MDRSSSLYKNFDLIFSNMRDGICAVNMNGEVLYVNSAAGCIFDPQHGGIIGKKLWTCVPYLPSNDDFIQLIIDSAMEKEVMHEAVVDYDCGDGKPPRKLRICVSCTQTALFDSDADERALLFIITDLTELFKVNSALVRYLSGDVADEILRTPEGCEPGGHKRRVTILISDLRGFTATCEKVRPEELEISGEEEIVPKGADKPLKMFDVCGIGGGYGVSFKKCSTEMADVPKNVSLPFRTLDGKIVERTVHHCTMLKISQTNALVIPDFGIKAADNIVLDINGDLYAKVISVSGSGCLICFTNKPDNFEGWMKWLFS